MKARHVRLVIVKEFLQLRRDPLLLRALFLMPILQLLLFGYVVAADVTNLRTAVVDLDRSSVSRALVDSFGSSGYFAITQRPATEAELTPLLDHSVVRVAIVIPEGTAARLERGENADIGVIVDGSDSTSSSVGSGYAAQIISRFNLARRDAAGVTGAAGPLAGAPGIDARVRVQFNPTLATVNAMIPGLVVTIIMISMMAIMSQAVVRERESGTLEQMFVTPITRGEYLAGKLIPYMIVATGQMTVVAVVGVLWFRVPFNGPLLVALTGIVLFMLTSVGMGLLVSLVSRTRHQAQQTVMFLMIPAMVLSGFIFPIESMPAAIQPVTYLVPLRFALEVLRGTAVKGAGWESLATPLLALAAYAVIILGAALLATRRRLAE